MRHAYMLLGSVTVLVQSLTAAPQATSGWQQRFFLKPEITTPGTGFGGAVSVAGDRAVVGRVEDRVQVYVRSGGDWVLDEVIESPNADDTLFGYAVAIHGDTLAVGDPFFGNTILDPLYYGAVYVYVRDGSGWTLQDVLTANAPTVPLDDDKFGVSVALWGNTIVVGAHDEDSAAVGVDGDELDNSAPNAGAAYVFLRNGSTWTREAYLKASNTDALDRFGFSVDLHEDTVVVGAPEEDSRSTVVDAGQASNLAPEAGAAYVFRRTGSTWSQEAYLKAPNTESDDLFARTVAVSGDRILVGAEFEDGGDAGADADASDNTATASGAAYTYVRTGSTWSYESYLKTMEIESWQYFGTAVDLDGDTAIVGTHDWSGATGVNPWPPTPEVDVVRSGSAYVFIRGDDEWHLQAYLKAAVTSDWDEFGAEVAISGTTALVGAPFQNSESLGINGDQSSDSGPANGAAYFFERADVANVEATEVIANSTPPNPEALRLSELYPPIAGAVWAPYIDHESFLPDAVVDALFVSVGTLALPVEIPGLGFLLCSVGGAFPLTFLASEPGAEFPLPIPDCISLLGLLVCAQGVSLDADLVTGSLTNAILGTVGTY